MDTRNAVAMFCHCPEDRHLPGCELLLWLIVRYGDPTRGIKGVAALYDATNCLSDEALEKCDTWYEQLHDMWVSERRMYLQPAECGWLA